MRRAIIAVHFGQGWAGISHCIASASVGVFAWFADLNLNYLLYIQLRFGLRLATRFYNQTHEDTNRKCQCVVTLINETSCFVAPCDFSEHFPNSEVSRPCYFED